MVGRQIYFLNKIISSTSNIEDESEKEHIEEELMYEIADKLPVDEYVEVAKNYFIGRRLA